LEFRHHKLDNGLEIIAECSPNAYSTAFAFFVKTGSRDESSELSGVSHFLEHMTFKGTPTRSAEQVNRELDEIGSQSNAFTSEEQTVYYATVLPEYQERAVELLSDIMRPSLREDDFTTEKKVILEEILKYEDQPPFGAHEKCMEHFFGDHPLHRNVLGTAESVEALTPDSMREYFHRRYSPGNITLVAAGNVDFDALIEQAERFCGQWHQVDTERNITLPTPQSGQRVILKENATQQYIVKISTNPAAEEQDRYAARILSTVLGDDSGSRLYWDLIETGLAEYACMSNYEFQGTGIMMTYLCCAPEDAAENLERLDTALATAERDGVTEKEIRQAQSKICSHLVLRAERPSNRLFVVGNDWIQRHTHCSVKESIEAYQAVTVADVAAVLKKYPLTVNSTVSVGPLAELAAAK